MVYSVTMLNGVRQLAVVMALLAQVWVSCMGGRVVCLAVAHEDEAEACSGAAEAVHLCDGDHEHEPAPAREEGKDEGDCCRCCVHVALPDLDMALRLKACAGGDFLLVDTGGGGWWAFMNGHAVTRTACAAGHGPELACPATVRALRATRLLT